MDRAFKVLPDSDYGKKMEKLRENTKKQKEFVYGFLKEKWIEATEGYYLTGDGFVNVPYKDHEKGDITLYIVPTESDLEKFGKMLKKPIQEKLQGFKKNSAIMKELANKCIEEKVIININEPWLRDYFKLSWQAYNSSRFSCEEGLFIKINSDQLKAEDNPEGFEEIKLSEFYGIVERYGDK